MIRRFARFAALPVVAALLLAPAAVAQEGHPDIRLNQIGYYPSAPKKAVVVDAPAGAFHVVSAGEGDTLLTGTLGAARRWDASGETVREVDFSALAQPGTYVLDVPGTGRSHPFEVASHVHQDVAKAALKGFYFQRHSTPLLEAHAGPWARPAGHPDDEVLVHPSAATAERPAGTVIAAPRGWYDAGDYNKYVVNSGITMGTLLALYEHFPAYVRALDVGIPESGDDVPDLLDELLWNLRWMLAMQDPHDGGVYHKLTNPSFDGMVMPDAATNPRYVVQKSTTAALDFAAVAAQAARVFEAYEDAFPGLADTSLAASLAAWDWARRNPDVLYDQRAMNEAFDPDVVTGAYGDRSADDEFRWAAAELYVTTKQDSFLTAYPPLADAADVPSWGRVGTLGLISLAHHRADLTPALDTAGVRRQLLQLSDALVAGRQGSAYDLVMGSDVRDFVWGSSAVAANQGFVLVQAYRLTGDERYLHAALANLDYLLGRNATGYSFVTGYGDRTPMFIHHRPSEADGVAEPVPGLLSGGPNPAQQDRGDCPPYPASEPATSFIDHVCSYASNEIAINWNAPLVYLAGAIEAIMAPDGLPARRSP